MVKLRLKRMGKKKLPIYRIIVADSRSPRDGRFIEEVGFYDPNKEPMIIKLKEAKVVQWLKNGAQPTETVKSLFKRYGLSYKLNLIKRGLDESRINEEMEKFESTKGDKLKREKERKLRRSQSKKKKKEEPKEEKKEA
ncbi:MAG: 30S ribosomal protein S16 [Ignavibacteriae bacterium]|nr:30S ribosomal protein S16 [Ignavibacteriota bacterium]